MALISTLVTKLTTDNSLFKKGMSDAERTAKNFSSSMSKMGGLLKGLFAVGGVVAFTRHLDTLVTKTGDLYDNVKKINVGIENFQALDFAAKKAGVSTGTLQNILAKMQSNLGKIGESGKSGVLESIGLSADKLKGMSPDEQFLKIVEGLEKIKDSSQRAYTAQQIFGKGGKEILGLLDGSLTTTISKYNDLGLAISEVDASILDSFGETKDLVGEVFKSFETKVLANLLGDANNLDAGIANLIKSWGGLNSISNTVAENIRSGFESIRSLVDDLLIRLDKINTWGKELEIKRMDTKIEGEIPNLDTDPTSHKYRDFFFGRKPNQSYIPSIAEAQERAKLVSERDRFANSFTSNEQYQNSIAEEDRSPPNLVPIQKINAGNSSNTAGGWSGSNGGMSSAPKVEVTIRASSMFETEIKSAAAEIVKQTIAQEARGVFN